MLMKSHHKRHFRLLDKVQHQTRLAAIARVQDTLVVSIFYSMLYGRVTMRPYKTIK